MRHKYAQSRNRSYFLFVSYIQIVSYATSKPYNAETDNILYSFLIRYFFLESNEPHNAETVNEFFLFLGVKHTRQKHIVYSHSYATNKSYNSETDL